MYQLFPINKLIIGTQQQSVKGMLHWIQNITDI